MTHPFDTSDGRCTVLADAGGQHSLWPAGTDVPHGWVPPTAPPTGPPASRTSTPLEGDREARMRNS
ncbi:MbtH family NRPS accessory protein [Streptomyces parvus]|uniref:MbtH family NRPS accessory protein n=1 Tax=Streptomyces parvus TaxID=66428 RepID=UPI00372055BF